MINCIVPTAGQIDSGGHSAYPNFVVEMLRKYYSNPDSIARSTGDIIERFWNLDLSYTDSFMKNKCSPLGPKPQLPSCMLRSYLFSINFKVTSITDWAAQLKIYPHKLALAGDSTPIASSARERKDRVCHCASKGIKMLKRLIQQ